MSVCVRSDGKGKTQIYSTSSPSSPISQHRRTAEFALPILRQYTYDIRTASECRKRNNKTKKRTQTARKAPTSVKMFPFKFIRWCVFCVRYFLFFFVRFFATPPGKKCVSSMFLFRSCYANMGICWLLGAIAKRRLHPTWKKLCFSAKVFLYYTFCDVHDIQHDMRYFSISLLALFVCVVRSRKQSQHTDFWWFCIKWFHSYLTARLRLVPSSSLPRPVPSTLHRIYVGYKKLNEISLLWSVRPSQVNVMPANWNQLHF